MDGAGKEQFRCQRSTCHQVTQDTGSPKPPLPRPPPSPPAPPQLRRLMQNTPLQGPHKHPVAQEQHPRDTECVLLYGPGCVTSFGPSVPPPARW